jgi:hypothetical protein
VDIENGLKIKICCTIHDGCYSVDFRIQEITIGRGVSNTKQASIIAAHIISGLKEFEHDNDCKFVGAGLTEHLLSLCPKLSSRLWLELDIVPAVFYGGLATKDTRSEINPKNPPRSVDEQADSVVRKCIMFVVDFYHNFSSNTTRMSFLILDRIFGPNHIPRLQIGSRNIVEVDAAPYIQLISSLEQYEHTVGDGTWNAVMKYADELRDAARLATLSPLASY